MVDPVRPALNADIEEEWGQWVHDRQVDTSLQFVGRRVTSFTIPVDAAWTKVGFDSRPIDVGLRWNGTSVSWVTPRAGWVEVCATICVNLDAPAAGNVLCGVWRNAAEEYRFFQHSHTSADQTHTASGTLHFAVGINDEISLQVYANYPGVVKRVYQQYCSMTVRYMGVLS